VPGPGGGLAGEYVLRALDECRLTAEATHGLRHLDADRPTAQDEQAPRNRLHAGRLAAAPDPLQVAQAGHGRHDRVCAVREDDVLGAVAHAVDLDDTRSGEPSVATEQVDPLLRQPGLLAGVGVVRHHEVAPRQCRVDVDVRGRRRVPGGLYGLPGTQERLGRNAGPVGAFTAHQLALDDGDAKATLSQRPGAVLARRACAEDDDVVVGAHGELLRPSRRRA